MINDLRQLLLNEPTINSMVATNIFVDKPGPGNTLPRIVIHQMGSDEGNDLDITGDCRAVNYDIDCEAILAQDAYTLAKSVREFIQDYSGPAGAETIDAVVLNDERSKIEKSAAAGATSQSRVTLDVDVLYRP